MKKEEDSNSYRSILKGTSVLGGTQIFLVILNLIRGKFVALFLGTDGLGVSSLFNSSQNTIQRLSSLGLTLAIVKEVADRKDDNDKLSRTLIAAGRLVLWTALAGSLICLFGSIWLSRVTFGNESYSWQFVLLAVSIFFAIESAGKMSVLQGLHKVRIISKASIIGGITGLIAGVPLYYFFGSYGIVPAMCLLSISMYVFYAWNLRAITKNQPRTRFIFSEHKPEIKKLLGLGIILMSSELIGTFVVYVFNIFIREFGSLENVGLFQSVNSLTAQSLGLIFSAMSLDYFPRLTAAAKDNTGMIGIVNRQAELIALITAPLAICLMLISPWVIEILLTKEFLSALPLMRVLSFAIIVKALSFPLGYISFAKDNKKLFFILEGIVCNILTLVLPCAGFYLFGLIGAGLGMVADNVICVIIYYFVNAEYYSYRFTKGAFLSYIYALVAGSAALLFSFAESKITVYAGMASILLCSTVISFVSLRHLITVKRNT